jgi:ribonuclease HI
VVVLAQRKLWHYFEDHPVTVVSSFPLGEIIRNLDMAGRIAKWSVELMGETLAYAPRKAIKSQILADFVAEWTDTQLPPSQVQAECWTLHFDGSVMKTEAGEGLLFISPLGEHMRYAVRLHFPASNNMAEYEALLCGLRIAIEMGIKRLDVRGNSQLMIDQVMKNASWHDDKMEAYCNAVWALKDKFYGIELNHVPRRYNEEADQLAKIASGRITVPSNVFAGYGADEAEDMDTDPVTRAEDWRDKCIAWMDRVELPPDRSKARRIARMASHSPSSMASCTSAPRQASCSDACPSLRGASSFETFTRAYAATTQRHAPSWATRSARASTGPLWSLMPASCAPVKGANFMPARPTSLRTPSRQSPSHGPSPCGG